MSLSKQPFLRCPFFFPFQISSLALSSARSAPALSPPHHHVLLIQEMAALAENFGLVDRADAKAASEVLFQRDGFEVVWIDTGAIAAKVVECQAFWYWSNQTLVTDAMGHLIAIRSVAKLAVPATVYSRLPRPARPGQFWHWAICGTNTGPQVIRQRRPITHGVPPCR